MDFLEKNISEHRKEMDELEFVPTDKMWDNILPEINKNNNVPTIRRMNIWKITAIAASILALIGWGLWFFHENETGVNLAEISPELAEREVQLQQLISKKEKELNFENIDKILYSDILNDIKTIDQNTEQTKSDISKFPDERAIETLIRNYELKIRILENLNRQIQKNKYHEELEKSI